MNINFTEQPVHVIGDMILDTYIVGTASRLSAEAPVPIVNIKHSDYCLGGAGNVAANIQRLGGTPVGIGVIGTDKDGDILSHKLSALGGGAHGLVTVPSRCTTTKTRIMVNRQQVARLDREDTCQLSTRYVNLILQHLYSDTRPAAVIISDYAKGVVSPVLVKEIAAYTMRHSIPLFIDPKIVNAACYAGLEYGAITCITPNKTEAEWISGVHINSKSSIEQTGRAILAKYGCSYALITLGETGMALVSDDEVAHIDTVAKQVFDVSGAGDTVIATLALAYASGYSMMQAARLANVAAGIVVGKSGTATVTLEEVVASGCYFLSDYQCSTL